MDDYNLKRLGRDLNPQELDEVTEMVTEETKKWKSLKPGMHFFVSDCYDDWFDHEIIKIDLDNRIIEAIDHSQRGKGVEINYLPTHVAFTVDELKKLHTSDKNYIPRTLF